MQPNETDRNPAKLMSVERKYYSPAEVADMMGVSKDTIMRRLRDDEIPHRRLGPQLIRIPAEWVEMDEQGEKPAEHPA